MKVKQQTLKCFEFEIDDAESFKEYYIKNEPLIGGHLLVLKGAVDDDIKNFLDERNVAFINSNEKSIITRKKRSVSISNQSDAQKHIEIKREEIIKNSELFSRTIRSGESIASEADLLFFGRINSGAVVDSSGSVQVFGIIDGVVRSDGKFMLLKEIGHGDVFFHGEHIDKSLFNGKLKLVTYENNSLIIKEVL